MTYSCIHAMRVISEMQEPSLFLKVKKHVFGGKVQGVELSQVCGWAVTGDTHGVWIHWEYAGQDKLSSSTVALVLSSATGFV